MTADGSSALEPETPVPISSHSSLDSFIMDLPASSDAYMDSAIDVNTTTSSGSNNNNDSNAATPGSASSLPQQQAMPPAPLLLPRNPHLPIPGVTGGISVGTTVQKPASAGGAGAGQNPAAPAASASQQQSSSTSIPEFLYQLTKMLRDDNREIIEWSNGRIEVHNPYKLESHVLHKYFRHSKFASFQRQLNYFGFRKLAGKGKMAPCSYVNEAATADIDSILLMKRKVSANPPEKKGKNSKDKPATGSKSTKKSSLKSKPTAGVAAAAANQQVKNSSTSSLHSSSSSVNPVLAGILQRNISNSQVRLGKSMPTQPDAGAAAYQAALAQSAVGKGVRHGCGNLKLPQHDISPATPATDAATKALQDASFNFPPSEQNDSLYQLACNYRNSLNDMQGADGNNDDVYNDGPSYPDPSDIPPLDELTVPPPNGMLARDDSLINLAFIPSVEETEMQFNDAVAAASASNSNNDDGGPDNVNSSGYNFVDFPNPEVKPAATAAHEPSSSGHQQQEAS